MPDKQGDMGEEMEDDIVQNAVDALNAATKEEEDRKRQEAVRKMMDAYEGKLPSEKLKALKEVGNEALRSFEAGESLREELRKHGADGVPPESVEIIERHLANRNRGPHVN